MAKQKQKQKWFQAGEPQEGDLVYGKTLGYVDKSHTWRWTECSNCNRFRWVRNVPSALRKNCKVCNGYIVGMLPKFQGVNNPSWKGGRKQLKSGYITIWIPKDDPYYCMISKTGHIREHRYIMAQHLKRPLESWEIVHHINSIRNDNRLSNLELLSIPKHVPTAILQARVKQLEEDIKNLRLQTKLLTWQLNCKDREEKYGFTKKERQVV